MNLRSYKHTKYFQSDLLKGHNFIHAFFTKMHEKNDPYELLNCFVSCL